MKTTEVKGTGIDYVSDVWFIWSSTLPMVWNPDTNAINLILSPPDNASRVLCLAPPRKYILADLEDLVLIEEGSIVILDDGRRGSVCKLIANSKFFLFSEDNDTEIIMAGCNQIVAVRPPLLPSDITLTLSKLTNTFS